MALAAETKFLLSEEPTAACTRRRQPPSRSCSENPKRRYTILLVERDMEAVFSLADRINVLVYGSVLFIGTPDDVRMHPEMRAVYLGMNAPELGANHCGLLCPSNQL